jgi:hypothetical protein
MTLPFVRSGKSLPGGRWAFLLGLALLPLALALSPRALTADVNRADRDRSGKGKGGGNAALQQAIDFEIIDVNNVKTIIDNRGIIAQDPRTSAGFGFFPANSPNDYTFGGGIWVGGIVNGTKVVSTGYDASGGFSEYNAGRAAVNGGGADQIICSNNAADLAQWYPEFSDAAGNPITFSQKDCIVIYNDTNQARDVRDPIGLEVRQRTMAFTFGALSQVVFIVWDIANTGSNTLQDAFVAANFDMDIGDSFQDDRCSAIPLVPPGFNNSSADVVPTNLGFCWDDDFNEGSFDPNPPGFVGMTFFQGPINASGDTLGLTRFTLTTNPSTGRPQPDPTSDAEQYDLLGGIGTRAPFIDATASDMRFVEISGPIEFAPGDQQTVVVGLIWANASNGRTNLDVSPTRCFPPPAGTPCFLPDPNDPILTELITTQRAAQVIFDANFLAPAPPPKPDITLIPGDHQVTIAWSDVSQIPDPFFAVAGDPTNPAFDPFFREFDFEGYVVVRSTSGDPTDVDTLAIFDLANDVTQIDDTTFTPFTIGDSVISLPTDIQTIISLPNTGLGFSFTDQGLINGITYFYDVAPFDFNPSNTLRGPNISLSSGISFQPSAVKGVRPRSNSSAFQSASVRFDALKPDGTVCDVDEPTATVDESTGHYTDFIDCSNAVVEATLTPLRDLNIPSGEFFFVIDSILPAAGTYSLEDFAGYNLAVGGNTVWYHWEDATGAIVSAIQPSVGSFDQFFTFFGAGETPLGFGLDTDPSDVGPDLSVNLFVASTYSVIEDLEVNGQSLHLGELGGTHVGEARPHRIAGSSLASLVNIGNARSLVNSREYAHAGPYAAGATSYQLTWSVSGGTYTGTLTNTQGAVVPPGGQPKGPNNPSTPDDFVSGYNWGFIGPGDPAAVRGDNFDGTGVFPAGAPLTNTMNLNSGDTFSIMVPGQSVYVEGITDLPDNGDVWTILIDAGSQRAGLGREGGGDDPNVAAAPFSYLDINDATEEGQTLSPVPYTRALVNVYPGARWRLSIGGGSNDPANVDLDRIKTVPNPYVANAVWDFSQDNQRIEFTNLPPECTIRIYTISGNLVRVIEHTNGSGTEVWDLRTRFNLKAASGTYYWHVTTPDGETKLGLTSIIQNEVGSN